MRRHMQHAVRLAEGSLRAGGRPVGALIVRSEERAGAPEGDTVLAACMDGSDCAGMGSCHPLHHPLMRCIDLVAQAQRQHRPPLTGSPAAEGAPSSGQKRPIPEMNGAGGSPRASPGSPAVPYLCTGYDAYVTVEPCAMCAMALVHSRIRRLVYAVPAADGALGSRYRLHTERSVNHHFQVFRGLLKTDALAVDPAVGSLAG